ncbi:protein-tyrosine phosphatase, partial [Neohortaea acidophila]
STGSTTPRVTIGPCPSRLQPLLPPFNYGTVDVHTIYRSSFPQDRNLDFLQTLKIRSILTLVDTDPSPALQTWIKTNQITHVKIHLATNKHGAVNITPDTLSQALLFVMNRANHPLHIHCNQGKHRTGCLVACLRKIQGVPLPDILAEYHAYAWPKSRDGDVKLITAFDPASVYEYAVR